MQTIKVILDKPRSLTDQFVLLGIVKDDDYFGILFDCKTNETYIEIINWGASQNIENAQFIQIPDDKQFDYIHKQIEEYTQILSQDNIRKVKENYIKYVLSYTKLIDYDLAGIPDIEDYVYNSAMKDGKEGFHNKCNFPCQDHLKPVIEMLKTKTSLLINNKKYFDHYLNLYIKIYKEAYIKEYNNYVMNELRKTNE